MMDSLDEDMSIDSDQASLHDLEDIAPEGFTVRLPFRRTNWMSGTDGEE